MAKKVLVVDDEGCFAEDAATVIGYAGFDVTIATSYTKAIQALEQHTYDVVTLDIMMTIGRDEEIDRDAAMFGRQTGLVLFEQIRQKWPQSKIVIVSVLSALDQRLHTLSSKGVVVRGKPISMKELIDAVKLAAG